MANQNTKDPSPTPALSPDISPKITSLSSQESSSINALPSDLSSHASAKSKGFDSLFDELSNKPPKPDREANAEEPPKPDLDTDVSKPITGENVDSKTLDEILGTVNLSPGNLSVWRRVSILSPPPVEDHRVDVPHFHVNSPKEEKTYNKPEGSISREDFEEYKRYMEGQVNQLSGWVHAAASKQWNAVRDLEIYKIKAAREKEKAELADKPVESIEVPNVPASTDSGRSTDIPALPDISGSTDTSAPTNSSGSNRYTTASQDSSRSTRYTTASPEPSRLPEKRSETAIPIEKIIGRPFQPVRKGEPMRRIGRLKRQMRELTIDLSILRAKTLWLQGDSKRWNEMENIMTESIHQALAIENVKLVAKCEFYRGIARFGLKNFWGAKDSFICAGDCTEVYTEGEEAREWYRKTEEAILTSPAHTSTPGTSRALDSATVSSWGGWAPWDRTEGDDNGNERLEEAERVRIELAKLASSEKPRCSSSGLNFSTEKPRTPPNGPSPNPESLSRGGSSIRENPRTPVKDRATDSDLLGSTQNTGARGRAPIPPVRFKPILPGTGTEPSEDSEPERVGRSSTRITKASRHRPLRISTDRSSRTRVRVAESTSAKDATTKDFERGNTAEGTNERNEIEKPKKRPGSRGSHSSDEADRTVQGNSSL